MINSYNATVPFQYQITGVDCVPCSILNALRCVYQRDEIPPEVVRTVWTYSLNSYDKKGRVKGTSMVGIELIADWLGNYKFENFDLETKTLYGHRVSRISIERTIIDGGVSVAEIQISRFYHYICILGFDKENFYCFDPYFRKRMVRGVRGKVERLKSNGFTPNLAINKKYLFSCDDKKKYSLGDRKGRVVILLNRRF